MAPARLEAESYCIINGRETEVDWKEVGRNKMPEVDLFDVDQIKLMKRWKQRRKYEVDQLRHMKWAEAKKKRTKGKSDVDRNKLIKWNKRWFKEKKILKKKYRKKNTQKKNL